MDKDKYLVINGKRIELTEEQIAILNEKEPEVIKESPFDIGSTDTFFWITSRGEVWKGAHSNLRDYIPVVNACKDKELMQQRAWREILSRLLWRASIEAGELDNPWDGNSVHYYIVFRSKANVFIAIDCVDCRHLNEAYFPSEESAKNAIENIVKPFLKAHPDFKI